MIGSQNSSIFDSPSFIQKIMKKKSSSSKYNIRPLYTADIIKQQNASYNNYYQKTKTYNHPSIQQAYIPSRPAPSLSPSISSTTAASSLLSDSAIVFPMPSSSTPVSNNNTKSRKRPLSSEILIKIMDQRILKMQQQQQQQQETSNVQLHRSASSSTTISNNIPSNATRLNKILTSNNHHATNTVRRKNSSGNTIRHQTNIKQQGNTTAMRKNHHQSTTKKLKSSKSVLNKLNHNNHHINPKQLITEWPYVLTQDNDEQDRMVAQHYLLRTAFNADYSSPIKSSLQKGIVVLDVGCGNGTWTMEMSTAYPKSTFIGIDQSAFYPKDIKPRNCHFRSCGSLSVQPSLPFPDNSIDYIYQRDLNWGLTGQTWQPLLLEYQRILKPGGWIEFVEPDLETQNSLENECAMNDKLFSGLSMRQQDPYLVHRLPTMLSINGFKRVEDYTQSFPLGWGLSHSNSTSTANSSILKEDEEEEELIMSSQASTSAASTTISNNQQSKESTTPTCSEFARAMSSQYLFLLKSLRPWLSTVMNLNYEKYDEYISGLPAEWSRAQTYINWHCIVAQKPLHA